MDHPPGTRSLPHGPDVALSLARAGDVHERTARRNVYTLMVAGFPIEKVEESEPVRFRFVPGRSLPQVPLDFAEAMALYQEVVASPVAQNPFFQPLIEAALHKILAVFPGKSASTSEAFGPHQYFPGAMHHMND